MPSHNLTDDDRGRRGSSRRHRQQQHQHRPRHAATAPFPLFMTASSSSSATAAATAAATALVGEEKKRTGEVRWEAASASIPHPRKADTGGFGLCVVCSVGGGGVGFYVKSCVFMLRSCTQLSSKHIHTNDTNYRGRGRELRAAAGFGSLRRRGRCVRACVRGCAMNGRMDEQNGGLMRCNIPPPLF